MALTSFKATLYTIIYKILCHQIPINIKKGKTERSQKNIAGVHTQYNLHINIRNKQRHELQQCSQAKNKKKTQQKKAQNKT